MTDDDLERHRSDCWERSPPLSAHVVPVTRAPALPIENRFDSATVTRLRSLPSARFWRASTRDLGTLRKHLGFVKSGWHDDCMTDARNWSAVGGKREPYRATWPAAPNAAEQETAAKFHVERDDG